GGKWGRGNGGKAGGIWGKRAGLTAQVGARRRRSRIRDQPAAIARLLFVPLRTCVSRAPGTHLASALPADGKGNAVSGAPEPPAPVLRRRGDLVGSNGLDQRCKRSSDRAVGSAMAFRGRTQSPYTAAIYHIKSHAFGLLTFATR